MKSNKLFGVGYFLNFIASSVFLAILFYFSVRENETANNELALTYLTITFLLVILPFNWICYSLHRSYRLNLQLLKKMKIFGSILFILFSILTVLEIIGSVDIINDIFNDKFYPEFRTILFSSLFFSITISSLYLCFGYWIVRKQTKAQFVDIIADLGKDTNI